MSSLEYKSAGIYYYMSRMTGEERIPVYKSLTKNPIIALKNINALD